ncbi:copper chaperone PCu(A)C [Dongia sp. agr-C8]
MIRTITQATKRCFILVLLLLAGAAAAQAADFKLGDITVAAPWSRATPNGAEVAAGFMQINNAGAAPDRLVAAASDIAGVTQIHEMAMKDGVMAMRELAGGLEIPAGGSVKLQPKSFHIMFMQLKHPLKAGDLVEVELSFEKAGKLKIEMPVGAMGASQAPQP